MTAAWFGGVMLVRFPRLSKLYRVASAGGVAHVTPGVVALVAQSCPAASWALLVVSGPDNKLPCVSN
ncbi:MAG: hypothetical protein ACOYN3_07600 [Acidimicrobiia bacterium]